MFSYRAELYWVFSGLGWVECTGTPILSRLIGFSRYNGMVFQGPYHTIFSAEGYDTSETYAWSICSANWSSIEGRETVTIKLRNRSYMEIL